MIQSGHCSAAGLANASDGKFYAAAPVANDEGWTLILKDKHAEEILQDDGATTKEETVTEAATILDVLNNNRTLVGLWMGGVKWTVTQHDAETEVGEKTCTWVFASRPKRGCHIISTGTSICVGFYDEEKGQTSGNCKRETIKFAEYMVEQ